ncbi:MAG: hypothetical protein J6S21_02575 [Victivallales bacterium]|nr:hypothetical protein [Victivallales bacterium]
MRRFPLILLTGILLCVMGAGCRSVPAPPGFIAAGSAAGGRIEFPGEISREARYAMLCWYVDEQGEAAHKYAPASLAVALNARMDLRNSFLAEAAAPLIAEYPQYISLNRAGRLEVDARALSGGVECGAAIEILERVRRLLNATGRLAVPVEECAAFLRAGKGAVAESTFLQWAQLNPVLELPPGSAAGLEVKIDDTEKALVMKRGILDAEAEARRMVGEGKFYELLDYIDKFARELPGDASLKIIGDETTLPAFHAFRQHIGAFAVDGTLQSILAEKPAPDAPEAEAELRELEERLSAAMAIWNTNSRYREALDDGRREQSRKAAASLAALRCEIWKARLEALAAAGRFWQMSRTAEELLLEVEARAADSFRCYFPPLGDGASAVRAMLKKQLRAAAEAGMVKYLAVGKSAMDIGNHFGVVPVTDYMVRRLAASAVPSGESMPRQWQQLIAASAETLARAGRHLAEKRSGIGVRDFAASAPGLGATLADDLAYEVEDLLKRLGITAFSGIRRFASEAETGDVKLLIQEGRVAEYGLSADTAEEFTRTESAFSAAKSAPGAGGQQFSNREERTIHCRRVTRQAHVRFFFTFQTPSLQRRIECNEFYTRTFENESFDPARDVRITGQVPAAQAASSSVRPALKQQRVWSDGEMLDFARRDALRLAALRLVDVYLESQLAYGEVAARLAGEGRIQEAADILGEEHFMLERLGLAERTGTTVAFGVPLAAAAYQELTVSIRKRVLEAAANSQQLLSMAADILDSSTENLQSESVNSAVSGALR